MDFKRRSDGRVISLNPDALLGRGREGAVYSVPPNGTLVAKIYSAETPEQKLIAMLTNPPRDPMAARGHISVAWPVDVLYTTSSKAAAGGYLMPAVVGAHPIFHAYNPESRREHLPWFTYQHLLTVAKNLASAIQLVHDRGYVIGDVNESNILVNKQALVTLVDTDSFQVSDPTTGKVFRCPVGKPEFTPPELQGKRFEDVDRTVEHDRFGLAVLIYLLLMEGCHPFDGKYTGSGDPPSREASISFGYFPYSLKRRGPFEPATLAPPIDILDPDVRALVIRCFDEGHSNPAARPDATTWVRALDQAARKLKECGKNARHIYGQHLRTCPWCERAVRFHGQDPFPAAPAVTALAAKPTASPAPPASSVPVGPSREGNARSFGWVLIVTAVLCFLAGSVLPWWLGGLPNALIVAAVLRLLTRSWCWGLIVAAVFYFLAGSASLAMTLLGIGALLVMVSYGKSAPAP